jgi:tetratricopeptide (TPR) repeat protein
MRHVAAILVVALVASTAVAQSKKASDYIKSGDDWFFKKDYDKAIADFTEAIRLEPKNARAYFNRGSVWKVKCDYAYVDRGVARKAKGDYDKAIADFTEAIRLDPKLASGYVARGSVWLDKGNHNKAVADYTEVIRLEPKSARGYVSRGAAWAYKKEYDKAIGDFNEVIRLNPKDTMTLEFRGGVWEAKGDYDKANADFNEAVRLAPRSAFAYRRIAWLRATCPNAKYRDGKKAVENATKACEVLRREDADFISTLAAAFAESGDFKKAVEQQTKAIKLAPEADKSDYRSRLDLYTQGKPYRDEKKEQMPD